MAAKKSYTFPWNLNAKPFYPKTLARSHTFPVNPFTEGRLGTPDSLSTALSSKSSSRAASVRSASPTPSEASVSSRNSDATTMNFDNLPPYGKVSRVTVITKSLDHLVKGGRVKLKVEIAGKTYEEQAMLTGVMDSVRDPFKEPVRPRVGQPGEKPDRHARKQFVFKDTKGVEHYVPWEELDVRTRSDKRARNYRQKFLNQVAAEKCFLQSGAQGPTHDCLPNAKHTADAQARLSRRGGPSLNLTQARELGRERFEVKRIYKRLAPQQIATSHYSPAEIDESLRIAVQREKGNRVRLKELSEQQKQVRDMHGPGAKFTDSIDKVMAHLRKGGQVIVYGPSQMLVRDPADPLRRPARYVQGERDQQLQVDYRDVDGHGRRIVKRQSTGHTVAAPGNPYLRYTPLSGHAMRITGIDDPKPGSSRWNFIVNNPELAAQYQYDAKKQTMVPVLTVTDSAASDDPPGTFRPPDDYMRRQNQDYQDLLKHKHNYFDPKTKEWDRPLKAREADLARRGATLPRFLPATVFKNPPVPSMDHLDRLRVLNPSAHRAEADWAYRHLGTRYHFHLL
jgi:hypothetical protein